MRNRQYEVTFRRPDKSAMQDDYIRVHGIDRQHAIGLAREALQSSYGELDAYNARLIDVELMPHERKV